LRADICEASFTRWAYAVFVILAFVWIPACTGFHLHRPPCEFQITVDGALNSLAKYKHITLWAAFFRMTWVHVRGGRHPLLIAAAAATAVGVLIEIEEGATGTGYCHSSDLLPDAIGALLGAIVATICRRRALPQAPG
jgi:hypothetical protein